MGTAPSQTVYPVLDLPSLKGKVVIITGSRSASLSILKASRTDWIRMFAAFTETGGEVCAIE